MPFESRWLDEAKRKGASHLVVVCDTFDHDDYPVYVQPGTDIHKVIEHYSENMQRVMEVYNMSMPLEPQVAERRAYHL